MFAISKNIKNTENDFNSQVLLKKYFKKMLLENLDFFEAIWNEFVYDVDMLATMTIMID